MFRDTRNRRARPQTLLQNTFRKATVIVMQFDGCYLQAPHTSVGKEHKLWSHAHYKRNFCLVYKLVKLSDLDGFSFLYTKWALNYVSTLPQGLNEITCETPNTLYCRCTKKLFLSSKITLLPLLSNIYMTNFN